MEGVRFLSKDEVGILRVAVVDDQRLFTKGHRSIEQTQLLLRLLDREVSVRLATLLSNLGNRFGETYESGTVLNM